MLTPLFSSDNRAFTHDDKNRLAYPAAIMLCVFDDQEPQKIRDSSSPVWLLRWRLALISINHLKKNKEEITTPQKVPFFQTKSPRPHTLILFPRNDKAKQISIHFENKMCVNVCQTNSYYTNLNK